MGKTQANYSLSTDYNLESYSVHQSYYFPVLLHILLSKYINPVQRPGFTPEVIHVNSTHPT